MVGSSHSSSKDREMDTAVLVICDNCGDEVNELDAFHHESGTYCQSCTDAIEEDEADDEDLEDDEDWEDSSMDEDEDEDWDDVTGD
jgi:hypothetical protein